MDQSKGIRSVRDASMPRRLLSRRSIVAALGATAAGALAFPIVRLVGRRGVAVLGLAPNPSLQEGLELHREQRHDDAVRAFTAVIEAEPDVPDAYLFRGIALFNAGQTRESIADFSEALELRPEDARPYLYRGESYLVLGNRAQAARDFQTALDLAGDDQSLAAAARAKLRLVR